MYSCINQMYLLHSYSSSHSYKCGAYHLIHTFVERFILKSCVKYCGIIHNQKRINNIIISFCNIYFLRHIYKLWWITITITTMHFNNSCVCWEFVILKPCHRIWTKNFKPRSDCGLYMGSYYSIGGKIFLTCFGESEMYSLWLLFHLLFILLFLTKMWQ